jgi:hypothetical protein
MCETFLWFHWKHPGDTCKKQLQGLQIIDWWIWNQSTSLQDYIEPFDGQKIVAFYYKFVLQILVSSYPERL